MTIRRYALTLALLLLPAAISVAQEPAARADWHLVWSDEFGRLDTTKWHVLTREQSKHGGGSCRGHERAIPEARPWYSEIDIMEFLGHEPNVVYGTLHYHTFAGEKKASSGTWRGNVDYTKDFHTYVLEWAPDSMRWYSDNKLIHTTVNGIPHTPHYLILNTAVGGGWPGNPDATTVFPQYHDIDYVRIYQRPRD